MAREMAYFQGKIVPLDEAKISVKTHAFLYGTACFEGIRGNWNEDQGVVHLFRIREHYEQNGSNESTEKK